MKRTGKGRFNIVLGLFVVLIPFLLASTGADVSADDTTSKDTTVTLHKLGYDKDQYPDQAIDNTGDSLADDGTVKAGTPIKGVIFTAYDRTDIYWTAYKAADGDAAAKMKAGQSAVLKAKVEQTEAGTDFPATDEAGLSTANLANLGGTNSDNAVYLVKETKTPDGVSNQKSGDFVIGLPIFKDEDILDKNIDIYPKNMFTTSTLEFIKYGIAVDSKDETKLTPASPLAGAMFVLKEENGDYLSNQNKFDGTTAADAQKFTSDKSGKVSVPDISLTSGKTYEFYEVDSTISKSANADKYHYLANRAPIKVTAKRGAADSKMVLTYTYIEQDSKKETTVIGTPDKDGKYVYTSATGAKTNEAKAYNTEVPEPDKTVDDSDVDIDENLTYKISQLIPNDIADYQEFSLVDTYDSQLALLASDKDILATVTIAGKPVSDVAGTFIDDATHNQFTVNFTPAELEKYAGKTIQFTVKMKVKPGAKLAAGIDNKVTFNNDFTPKEHKATVKTYGKQFIKTEWLSGKQLGAAEFIVQRGNSYLQYVSKGQPVAKITGYTDTSKDDLVWVTDKDQATKLISDDNGQFGVQGLAQAEAGQPIDYQLIETKAPEGHVILKDAVVFNADNGTEKLAQKVVNHSKGILPHTGGKGIIIFIATGCMLILVSIIYFKKRNGQTV